MAKKFSSIVRSVDDEQEFDILPILSTNSKNENIKGRQSERSRIVLNFQLIWLDPSIDESNNDFHNSMDQLKIIFHTIKIFTDTDECLDFVTDIRSEKLFMILPDNLGRYLIPLIHNVPQLISISIFCQHESTDRTWTKNWSKVNGIFTQVGPLVDSFKQRIWYHDQNSISISIVPPSIDLDQDLDQLDPTFMYTQLLKEILLEIEYDEESIKNMAEHFRSHYINVEATLKEIKQFEEQYHKNSPIWWYTAVTFVYTMLNRALRHLEVDTIINMGVFIRDLHLYIKERHAEQMNNDQIGTFTVYRGQGMSQTDFQKMKNNPGGLLSFNNFLSTSGDRSVSFAFADSVTNDPNLIGVLFQMQIDQSISSTSFARISDISQYESEDETLFSMNAVFRIGEIKALDVSNRLWQVDLTITSDNDPQLNALADYMRKETKNARGWHRLIPLLIRLGEFEKAEQLCKILLQTTFQDAVRGSVYGYLGHIYDNLSDYRQSISWYKSALEIMEEMLPSNHETLASTYNNIGLAYKNMGEHSNALSFLKKSLEIYERIFPPDHPYFGTIYNNIGVVYDVLGNRSKALSFYEKSITFNNALPKNHPETATCYKNICEIYTEIGEYPKALEYIEKAFQIEQKALPPNHPSFAITYGHMGNIYSKMSEYSKAISFHEKALEITEKNYQDDHCDVAVCYSNLGTSYQKLGEHSKAILFLQKSIKIKEKIVPSDQEYLASSYNTLGLAHYHLGKHSEALSYCQKSLDIRQRIFDPDHIELASSYDTLGGIYMGMGNYPKALAFFEKARAIEENSRPLNYPDLANIYSNMGCVYFAIREFAKAIEFNEKALEIRRRILNRDHPNLADSYIGVAGSYFAMGRLTDARSAHDKAAEIVQRSLPPDHPLCLASTMMYQLLHM